MPTLFETTRDSFTISTDPSRLDMKAVEGFLSRSYWARGRPRDRTETAFANSVVFGMYEGLKQIGLARVVTDWSIVAYLCDVFIDEGHRGRGLGKWLVQSVLDHPGLKDIRRWLLTTDDAHELYSHYGFTVLSDPEKWMQRFRAFQGE